MDLFTVWAVQLIKCSLSSLLICTKPVLVKSSSIEMQWLLIWRTTCSSTNYIFKASTWWFSTLCITQCFLANSAPTFVIRILYYSSTHISYDLFINILYNRSKCNLYVNSGTNSADWQNSLTSLSNDAF